MSYSRKSKSASKKSKGSKICPAGKAWAQRTFDTYPSAYANMAASKYCKDPNYAENKTGLGLELMVKSKVHAALQRIRRTLTDVFQRLKRGLFLREKEPLPLERKSKKVLKEKPSSVTPKPRRSKRQETAVKSFQKSHPPSASAKPPKK